MFLGCQVLGFIFLAVNNTFLTTNPSVYVTWLKNPNTKASFYIIRQVNASWEWVFCCIINVLIVLISAKWGPRLQVEYWCCNYSPAGWWSGPRWSWFSRHCVSSKLCFELSLIHSLLPEQTWLSGADQSSYTQLHISWRHLKLMERTYWSSMVILDRQ